MKPSKIEDAIEAGIEPKTYVYLFEGHSDDVLMLDSEELPQAEEYYSAPSVSNSILVRFSNDSGSGIVVARYIFTDTWAIAVTRVDEDTPLPNASYTVRDQDGYSPVLVIESVQPLEFTGYQGD